MYFRSVFLPSNNVIYNLILKAFNHSINVPSFTVNNEKRTRYFIPRRDKKLSKNVVSVLFKLYSAVPDEFSSKVCFL